MQWVVAFKGSRDAYQVPLALAEAGKLEALVTDWYSPFDAEWFTRTVGALPRRFGAQLRRRYTPGLPSVKVRARPLELLRTKLDSRAASDRGDNRLGDFAGRVAADKSAGLLSYSYYGHAAFTARGAERLPKVIFQVHPHPRSIRGLFTEELELTPEARSSLASEIEMNLPESRFEQLCAEPLLADLCVAASEYTKRTLVENGVAPERVRVVPYGVDLEKFRPPSGAAASDDTFRVVFAGQMIQRKGLSYLLEAWRRLNLPRAELTLVGRGGADRALLAKYEGTYKLRTAATAAELRELYQTSDVCCMPSLVEGFGLVYLEALACGTPVIATPNTGAADVIADGREGFIVPIRSIDALCERLLWCYEHRRELAAMRPGARSAAEKYTWAAFRRGTVAAIDEAERRAAA